VSALTKLVDHCVWANGEWIAFVTEHFREDDFCMARISHILLGEQA
jgi:hypothetical protein